MTDIEMNIVNECIRIIQKKIVRNGDTPENIRSRQHVIDIQEQFGIEIQTEEKI